jgi:chemotaxis protein methyltransferase CheR
VSRPRDAATGTPPEPAVRAISDREFALFQALVRREAGIHLAPAKKALVVGRLSKRLRELGLSTFEAYYHLVTEHDAAERVRMIDRICTNETHFFREAHQFTFLEREICGRWSAEADGGTRPRTVHAWSAACSTGEEPYSLAMVLLSRLPPESGWRVGILATDLSTRALETAKQATWPVEKAKEIPGPYLKRFMLKGTRSQEGQMRADDAVRKVVEFARQNLNDDVYGVGGPFDLILCRNVLIYFEPETKRRVVNKLVDLLAPGGYLFVGHAESLSGLTDRARPVGPMVYSRIPAAGNLGPPDASRGGPQKGAPLSGLAPAGRRRRPEMR